MAAVQSHLARAFAVDVVQKLRDAGYETYWAGGCVRDELLQREPKDYDVATSAPPDVVRQVFGTRRTHAIGAAFGVITVLGPRGAGQIDVATFRRDLAYRDGRHPEGVEFTSAAEDARRRDFTINGLFYDPLTDRHLDFVGGRDDLARRILRAIGDPHARFAEDKLRMLRAVRFAITFDLELENRTREAVEAHAAEISQVSAERIAAEMRRMLVHPRRDRAMRLLREVGLLDHVLPEMLPVARPAFGSAESSDGSAWATTLAMLQQLVEPAFPMALAALLHQIHAVEGAALVPAVARRWRLSRDETETTAWILEHEPRLRIARRLPWPTLQRILIQPPIAGALAVAEVAARVLGQGAADVAFCRDRLELAPEQLNPPPLLDGAALKALQLRPGPAFRQILERVRDAQLEGRIHSREEAQHFASGLAEEFRRESP